MVEHGNLPNAEYRRFESVREYEALIDTLIPRTQRAIRVFDRVLSRAYNSPQRIGALGCFLRASPLNRLLIVLHEPDSLGRDCPRLLELLRRHSPALRIRRTLGPARQVYDPFVVFDASHYVHRFHYQHLRAAQGTNDLAGAQLLLDRFGEIWEASAPAIALAPSGL